MGPQYNWFVKQLTAARKDKKAVLLALHYPPYSGMTNFESRGNPKWSNPGGGAAPLVRYPGAEPLANVLQQAFEDAGQRPDAVFSAHAHLYQRITYTYLDGYEIPYLIVGSGGHGVSPEGLKPGDPGYYLMPEQLTESCAGKRGKDQLSFPYHLVQPDGLKIASGDQAVVSCVNDRDFGFLRVTVDMQSTPPLLTGEFFAVPISSAVEPPYATYPPWPTGPDRLPSAPFVYDSFSLILDSTDPAKHKLL